MGRTRYKTKENSSKVRRQGDGKTNTYGRVAGDMLI
jgi:hypothetical protein